jgi:hypothetical protein
MPENQPDPLIKLEEGGKGQILSYDLPEPTSYTGKAIIELGFDRSWFKDSAEKKPKQAPNPTPEEVAEIVEDLGYGVVPKDISSNARVRKPIPLKATGKLNDSLLNRNFNRNLNRRRS